MPEALTQNRQKTINLFHSWIQSEAIFVAHVSDSLRAPFLPLTEYIIVLVPLRRKGEIKKKAPNFDICLCFYDLR